MAINSSAAARPALLDDAHRIGLVEPTAVAVAADAAYAAFFRAEFTNVTRAVYLVVHDAAAAEDLAQESFTELLLRWDRISTYERPDAWVRRIAIRKAVRFARRERLRGWLTRWIAPPRPAPASLDPTWRPRSGPWRRSSAPRSSCHYLEDRPLAEVATLLGCSHATARVHVFKARRRLAEMLGPEILEADDDL